jgi:hypothetical protein
VNTEQVAYQLADFADRLQAQGVDRITIAEALSLLNTRIHQHLVKEAVMLTAQKRKSELERLLSYLRNTPYFGDYKSRVAIRVGLGLLEVW